MLRFSRAIVREPARSVVDGLSSTNQGAPGYDAIRGEHQAYVGALQSAGVSVTTLPPLDEFPDSVFIEDPALVFPEGAILLRPGAPSRAAESDALAPVLRDIFETVLELPSGYADGGDVLETPAEVLIGLSARTGREGAEALADCLAALGRKSRIVQSPSDVLHLKTACSLLDQDNILCTPALAESGIFEGFRLTVTPEGEAAAANALRVNQVVLAGAGFPRTIELLGSLGFSVVALETAEIGKLDAGLSCMSLRW